VNGDEVVLRVFVKGRPKRVAQVLRLDEPDLYLGPLVWRGPRMTPCPRAEVGAGQAPDRAFRARAGDGAQGEER
jgi:hypothetical protein